MKSSALCAKSQQASLKFQSDALPGTWPSRTDAARGRCFDIDQMRAHQCRNCRACRRATLLISLNNAILAAANLQITDLSYSVGDTIFEHGAPAPFVYVVSKGALVRFRSLPGGRRSILQFLFAGDGFGYEPSGYHRATVQALTDAEVVATGRKGVMAASKSNSAPTTVSGFGRRSKPACSRTLSTS